MADIIIFMLATWVGLWGLTLAWRGLVGQKRAGICPSCGGAPTGLSCDCGFTATDDRDMVSTHRSLRMTGAGLVCMAVAPMVWYWGATYAHMRDVPDVSRNASWYGASAGLFLFGLIVASIGWHGERSRGRRRCAKCWYDMGGTESRQCPECGHVARSERGLYRPRRRQRVLAFGVVLMAASVVPLGVMRYQAGGVIAVIPTSFLILGLDTLPSSAIESQNALALPQDWTLEGRVRQGRMWNWQRAWLMQRSRRWVERANTLEQARRGWNLLDAESPRSNSSSAPETFQHVIDLAILDLTVHDGQSMTEFGEEFFAGQSLDGFGDAIEAHGPALRRVIRTTDNDACAWAMYFSSTVDADWVADTLLKKAMEGRSGISQIAAAQYINHVARHPQMVDEIAVTLRIGDVAHRRLSVMALGRIPGDDARDALLSALLDQNDEVAALAARALTRPGSSDDTIGDAILDQIESDRATRADMMRSLLSSQVMRPRHLERLAALLDDDDGEIVEFTLDVMRSIALRHHVDVDAFRDQVTEAAERDDVELSDRLTRWLRSPP